MRCRVEPARGLVHRMNDQAKPPTSMGVKLLAGIGCLGVLGMGTCATCAVIGAKGAADGVKAGAGVSAPAEPEAPAAPAASVEIGTLLSEYKDNEVRADAAYKGKTIKVTGAVDDIKKDILDNPYITVGTGKQFEIPQVQCSLAKSSVGAAMQLSKGAKVTVVGKVSGLMMNVQISDCVIQ